MTFGFLQMMEGANDLALTLPLGGGIHSIDNRRLLEPIGNVPPAEAEAAYYDQLEAMPVAA